MEGKKFLHCKHPIVCLPMNRVSDIDLAIAVGKAGCLPSIIMASYSAEWGKRFLDYDFKRDLIRYLTEVKSLNIMVSMTDFFLVTHHKKLFEILNTFKISHVEIIPYYGQGENDEGYSLETYIKNIMKIKSYGTKIIVKCLKVPVEPIAKTFIDNNLIDSIIVKSNRGAGRVSDHDTDTVRLVKKTKALYPNVHIIASGGVSTSSELKELLDAGATAVGFGTVFAMSKESKICEENKHILVSKTSEDIERMPSDRSGQNAVIFKPHEGWDNGNNSKSLEKGVEGKGGHLFIGHGIDNINEVLSVSEIVSRLTESID